MRPSALRLRAGLCGDDSGSALLYVLLVSMMVMLAVVASTTAVVAQIRPTRGAQDNSAALAAAQAGIEDFIAWANANCPASAGLACSALIVGRSNVPSPINPATQRGAMVPVPTGASASSESFWWVVTNTAPGVARVKSVGQVPTDGSATSFRTATLVADVNASPSFTNFEYYTKYETYSSDFLSRFYAARTIQVTSAASLANTSIAGAPGTLNWSGTCSYVDAATTPTCDPARSLDICEDFYYPSGSGPGRATNTAWSNSTRRPTTAAQGAMGTDSTFAYYSELGTYASAGGTIPVTHYDTCDTSFEPNMVMSGPVYSEDAYLVDRGKDTGNSANSMPVFGSYAYSLWSGYANGSTVSPGPNGGYVRAYPGTNGQASSDVSPLPVYTTDKLDLPANGAAAQSLATCTYTGPTRVLIRQGTAYITSPGTPAGPGACYTSTGAMSAAGGVVNAQLPIASALIYVKNPAGTASAATRENPVFRLTNTTPVPAPSTAASLATAWPSAAPYSAADPCPAAGSTFTRRSFDCEGTSDQGDLYARVLSAANAALAAGAPTTAQLQAQLTTAITAQFAAGTLKDPRPSSPELASYYTLSVGLPTITATPSTPPAANPVDPLYQAGTSGGFTTRKTAATISLARITCTATKSGECTKDQATPIIAGEISASASTGSDAVTTNTFPWFGAASGPSTYTDPGNDVTQYSNGQGDAYVEGNLKGQLSIVAEHDIVITNDTTYSNSNLATTSDGLALVANHDVRVYRPMTCTHNGSAGATSAGYCPDDLTGVYSDPLSWPLPDNHPSTAYKASSAPSMTTTGTGNIYASVFALRGSFMADNFYRGAIGSTVSVHGGLYQFHRGATSLPYQGRPYQGSGTKMPGISLDYSYDNMRSGQLVSGGMRVPWIPTPPGASLNGRSWNVSSLSTGG